MAVVTVPGHAREATTDLTVLERLGGFTLLEASLRTGRTHQIRVHCAYIGHPVVGDPTYGGNRRLPSTFGPKDRLEFERILEALAGQALHAYKLSFDHPRTGEHMEFHAPMPREMQMLIDWIRIRSQL
jgi:23S rRNA pseudouridine1911/1915/1917 synthase